MDRILEPELMMDEAQTLAYAQADFDQVNQGFVDRYRASFPRGTTGDMVDLGCGPGDIPVRLARALPGYRIIAIDGSEPMVLLAQKAVKDANVPTACRCAARDCPCCPCRGRASTPSCPTASSTTCPTPSSSGTRWCGWAGRGRRCSSWISSARSRPSGRARSW